MMTTTFRKARTGKGGPGRLFPVSLALLIPAAAAWAGDQDKLAVELSRLRGEVEALSCELDAKKEDHRARLRSLASRKADLEMEIQREELRLRQARATRAKQRDRVSRIEKQKHALGPVLREALDLLRKATRDGLPFQLRGRLADLDRLESQLADHTLTSPTVLARLWSKAEDEFRLARENGLYKQVIEVGGEEVLADIARVGMIMLFFRTPDDGYGRAVRTGDGWAYRLYRDEDDIQRVATLFDSLKKRIRTGYFELPAALPGGGHD